MSVGGPWGSSLRLFPPFLLWMRGAVWVRVALGVRCWCVVGVCDWLFGLELRVVFGCALVPGLVLGLGPALHAVLGFGLGLGLGGLILIEF